MLVVMSGLIVWKMSSEDDPAPTPVALPSPPPVIPEFESPPPPPPPPIEEVVDSGKQSEAPRKKAGGGNPACAGECDGTITSQLDAALHGRARQGQGCYERALRQNPTLQGRLMIRVRVGPKGEVCSARVASDALGDSGVTSCVLQKFLAATFPPPTGGCVDTQVPMNFVPKP
jgi:hypothetical protein